MNQSYEETQEPVYNYDRLYVWIVILFVCLFTLAVACGGLGYIVEAIR